MDVVVGIARLGLELNLWTRHTQRCEELESYTFVIKPTQMQPTTALVYATMRRTEVPECAVKVCPLPGS